MTMMMIIILNSFFLFKIDIVHAVHQSRKHSEFKKIFKTNNNESM